MLLLLIKRYIVTNSKNKCKSFFVMSFIFTVFFSFSLLLITIYHNKVSEFTESLYNYKLSSFNEDKINEIKSKDFVNGLYATRLINATIYNGEKKASISLNAADGWDTKGISHLGENRSVKGNLDNVDEDSLIIDILTARKLNVGIGDKVDFYFKDVKTTYEIKMLIEPDDNTNKGIGVCLYNSYFREAWGTAFSTMPVYSSLYVQANDELRADEYFLKEYIAPPKAGKPNKDIKNTTYNSNYKKVWFIEDAERELEFTPPITIIISILGFIAVFIFIWRETAYIMDVLNKDLAILTTLGMRMKHMICFFLINCCIVQIPSILAASIIVKTVVYDRMILNYYLPWKIIWYMNFITIVFSVLIGLIVSTGICIKFKKSSISKILASE